MSESNVVAIRGIDPLLFRDARPFSADAGGHAARTLPVPLPSTIAGFVRTRIGNARGWDWAADGPSKAREIAVAGPILMRNGEPVFVAPRDALLLDDPALSLTALRPGPEGGCDLPVGMQPLSPPAEGKPASGYALWPWSTLHAWLLEPDGRIDLPPKIDGMEREERVHVGIGAKGVADEGQIYTTQLLAFERHQWKDKTLHEEWALLAAAEATDAEILGVGTLGGERRLAAVEPAGSVWPVCPAELRKRLTGARRIRMTLATPALFSEGWRPGWTGGAPPGCPDLRLRLVAAAVGKREAFSGWDFEFRKPRPLRHMVPAGSTYFFEVEGNSGAACLADAGWLTAVSDNEQDRRDGFGLALWGVW